MDTYIQHIINNYLFTFCPLQFPDKKRCSARLTSSYFSEGSCHICYLCLFAHSGVQHPLTILVTWWTIQEHLRSSSVCVALRFSVLSCVFFSLFLCHVSFVSGVASVYGLSICACPFFFLFFFVTCLLWPVLPVYLDCLFVLALSVFSFSSSRVFCSRCCQCIWIVYLCLPFLFSLFLRHVSFVPGVASVSGLSICACPFLFLFFFVTCLF